MSGPEREQEPTGEDASATVELAVLLPVYLLLTFALLTIGELVLVRQGTVLAARYRAWVPGKALGDPTVTRSFFGKLAARGSFSSDAATQDVSWSEADVALDATARARIPGPDPDSAAARKLALAVLGDSANGPHLRESRLTGSFAYTAPWLPRKVVTPNATCAVYAKKEGRERRVYRTSGPDAPWIDRERHPIESYRVDPERSFALEERNRFFPPTAPFELLTSERGIELDPGPIGEGTDEDPGIWSRSFRLGGSSEQEHAFYKRMLGE